jgi:hypothetical protein
METGATLIVLMMLSALVMPALAGTSLVVGGLVLWNRQRRVPAFGELAAARAGTVGEHVARLAAPRSCTVGEYVARVSGPRAGTVGDNAARLAAPRARTVGDYVTLLAGPRAGTVGEYVARLAEARRVELVGRPERVALIKPAEPDHVPVPLPAREPQPSGSSPLLTVG